MRKPDRLLSLHHANVVRRALAAPLGSLEEAAAKRVVRHMVDLMAAGACAGEALREARVGEVTGLVALASARVAR